MECRQQQYKWYGMVILIAFQRVEEHHFLPHYEYNLSQNLLVRGGGRGDRCLWGLCHVLFDSFDMTMFAAGQQDHDRDPAPQPGRPRGEEVRLLGR